MKLLADALKPGDTIGLVSPSNTIDDDEDYQAIEQSIKWAESQGLKVIQGKYFGINKTGYGLTGRQKAEEINEMFANKDVKAVFAVRGGENSNAAFDYLDWETIKNNPKIIMGFSDTTSLLNEINYQTGLVTFSGPTFKRLYESEYSKKSVVDRLINKDLKLATEEDYSECDGQIGKGLLVLLGVHRDDTEKEASKIADKICGLRIFEDEAGKMNLSPDKVGAGLLIISQFTLFADCRSRRPGFSLAARPETAVPLYEQVIRECRERGFQVETGVFAAEMMVDSENDGPVTILLDTNEL